MTRVNLQFIQQNQGVYQSGQDDGLSTQLNRKRSYFGPVDIEKLEIKLLSTESSNDLKILSSSANKPHQPTQKIL